MTPREWTRTRQARSKKAMARQEIAEWVCFFVVLFAVIAAMSVDWA